MSVILRKQRADALTAAKQIHAKAEAENRDLTAEEKSAFDGHCQTAESLKGRIERSDAMQAVEADLDTPEPRKVPSRAADVKVGEDRANDDPMRGFNRGPREFVMAVMEAGQGRRIDKRLMPLRQTAGSDEAGTHDDSRGGFLVPVGLSPQLLQVEPEMDPFGAATTKVPMATTRVQIPARTDKNHTSSVSGGLTVTRRPETVAGTSSRMAIERVELAATSLFGLSYVSEELLTDSPISFAAILQAGFKDEFAARLIDERLNGTGVGEYMGVMQSPALISVSAETPQDADTIVYENVINMRSRVWRYGQAIWIANHDTIPQLMLMNQTVGAAGTPVWQPSAREDHPDILLGRPIVFTEFAQKLGDAGDIVCVNPTQYLEGEYQPLQQAESIHVRFVEHERAFKFWTRNAGAPWWRSALTPKYSAVTLSPFVALAAR
jgi:HK97 family phage major capsid protein